MTKTREPTSDITDSFDDYYDLLSDDQEKVDGALVLTLCSMKWQVIDEATKLELENITKANIMARHAKERFMKKETSSNGKKKETSSNGKRKIKEMEKKETEISKKPRKINANKEKSNDIRNFKKPLLGFGEDDCELPILPPVERLKGLVGICSKPFQKVLTFSDVNEGNCRLTLVRDYTLKTILPLLDGEERNILKLEKWEIEVPTFDEQGNEYTMVFSKWAEGKFYVLKGKNWNAFVQDHSLKGLKDWVSVWSFRHLETRRLCFAIAIKRVPIIEKPTAMLCSS